MLNEVPLPQCIPWREWSFAQHDNVFVDVHLNTSWSHTSNEMLCHAEREEAHSMLETLAAQVRFAASMVFGLPFSARSPALARSA
jgi:hypothetical protein